MLGITRNGAKSLTLALLTTRLIKLGLDPALVGHFKVLELTWDLANEVTDFLSSRDYPDDDAGFGHINGLVEKDTYRDLCGLLSVDAATYNIWLNEVYVEHFVGLISPDFSVSEEYLTQECCRYDSKHIVYKTSLLKSICDIINHPLAFNAAENLMDFIEHSENSEHFENSEKGKYRRIAMDAYRGVAQLDGHADQFNAAQSLMRLGDPNDNAIAINVIAIISQNKNHISQCNAVEKLIELINDDSCEKYIRQKATKALICIANDDTNSYQADAQEQLKRLKSPSFRRRNMVAAA